MDNYSFNTVGLCAEDINRLNDTYKALKAKFNVETTGYIDFYLEEFDVFKNYPDINLRGSFVIKYQGNESYIFFIEKHFRRSGGRGQTLVDCYEYQTWALAYLKKDFGRVLIRKETLADKIIELVHPVELDFDEDKPFSDTFYVLVNDHQKAVEAINRNFRNAVMDIRHDDFVIEIMEHTLIIGDQKPVSPERAVYLAEFVARISSIC